MARGQIAPIIRRHPLTGEPIEPVGIVNNKYIWPIMGGAPDDQDDDDDDDEDDKGDDDSRSGDRGADDADDGDDKDSDSDDDEDEDDDDAKISKADYDRLKRRMQAADKRADKAEQELRKRDDANKDDLTKQNERVAELEQKNKGLESEVSAMRLQVAFLTTNRHSWHNSEAALKLAQSEGYLEDILDEDGQIDKKALKRALDRLAGDHKYLVKPKDSKDDKDKDKPSGEPGPRRSGNGKDKAVREKQLQSRFSVLNR